MYELFITTIARKQYSDDEIKKIVSDLSVRNTQHSLTGVLIYNDGEFYQILEGEQSTLEGLRDEILNDELHGGVHVIWEGGIKDRGYTNWGLCTSMMGKLGLDTIYAEKGNNVSTSQRLLETLARTSGFKYSTVSKS